jgi:hypothetical protein
MEHCSGVLREVQIAILGEPIEMDDAVTDAEIRESIPLFGKI